MRMIGDVWGDPGAPGEEPMRKSEPGLGGNGKQARTVLWAELHFEIKLFMLRSGERRIPRKKITALGYLD